MNITPETIFTTLHILHNLQMAPTRKSVCPWQAIPAWCNEILQLIALVGKLQRKWSVVNTTPEPESHYEVLTMISGWPDIEVRIYQTLSKVEEYLAQFIKTFCPISQSVSQRILNYYRILLSIMHIQVQCAPEFQNDFWQKKN